VHISLAPTWFDPAEDQAARREGKDVAAGVGCIWRIMWTVLTREAGGRVKRCSAIASALGIS